MQIDKVSNTGHAAMTGQNAEWQGQVQQVDQNAGTVTVDGQNFTVDPAAAVGVELGELQPGDQVRTVDDDARTAGKQVVEITKVD